MTNNKESKLDERRSADQPHAVTQMRVAITCSTLALLFCATNAFTAVSSAALSQRRRQQTSPIPASLTAVGARRVESSYETFGDAALSEESFTELYTASSSGEELPLWLTERCSECGWPTPTLVQRRSLDAILTGMDVVIQAQTGSGKTLSFLLPLLSKIDASRSAIQAVIVVPTRELGLQISRVARRLAAASGPDTDAKGKIMVMPILQGSRNKRQRAWAWAEPPHVVVGTPDELTKMVSKGGIRYNAVKFVVVDEVDACLLNNGGSIGMSNLASAGPLHELLSRYLSPTYDEVDVLDGDSASLVSSSAADLAGSSKTVPMVLTAKLSFPQQLFPSTTTLCANVSRTSGQ
uniref:Helicase ATP-binding domain-containing protein n=1 Tax=Odontella aurita TaxID=265563 RepID=A0A7S4J1Z4_9STRA|mmetsp:Transcript_3585/g.9594  ORF Transcript_3585/g.9594 Transcript_3585/m.9594 type:complete len:351 (+) Transcript_3585:63-1115(+)